MGAAEFVLRHLNHAVRRVRRRPDASASVMVTLGVATGLARAILPCRQHDRGALRIHSRRLDS